jgi:hypothetical protein
LELQVGGLLRYSTRKTAHMLPVLCGKMYMLSRDFNKKTAGKRYMLPRYFEKNS